MTVNVIFLDGLQPQNSLIVFLFSMKHSYLLTAKLLKTLIILSDFYMVWKSYYRQFSACQKKLICLIMASTKLMEYVCVTSLFCK